MNSFSLFDSYQKKIVQISPESLAQKNILSIYSCGPTVYNYMHIGNLRATWLPDTIAKIASIAGYDVNWVQNITDVGHLVDDGDNGEDKLEKGAKRENKTVTEIVNFYTDDFKQQCKALNLDLPTAKFQPKASEYIKEQMLLALELVRDQKAYVLDDGIYFDSEANKAGEVVDKENETINKLVEIIKNKSKDSSKPFIIAVDGRAGSGKTTFAKYLVSKLENTKHFNLDDFAGQTIDFFSDENILKRGESIIENRFYDTTSIISNFKDGTYNFFILEGCFSFKNLSDLDLGFKIWIEVDSNTSFNRLNNREIKSNQQIDPDKIISSSKTWQQAENRYLANFKPKEQADIVISTENEDYEIIANNSELTDLGKNTNNLIQKWWSTKFPEIHINTIEPMNNGINCNFKINNRYLLKILSPKYVWDKKSPEKFDVKFSNYLKIQSIELDYTPKIILVEHSEVFDANVVIMELIQGQDLFEIYYNLSDSKKQDYLTRVIVLIKNFHSKTKQNNEKVLAHNDIHLGNILVEQNTDKLWLIDFDNIQEDFLHEEMYGIMQGFLLPKACVGEELEKHYQIPLYKEFVDFIKQYPELLNRNNLSEIKRIFKDCFEHKKSHQKFKQTVEKLFHLVFEQNLFELLAGKKYQEALDLFEKEFGSADYINYTGREIVNTTKNPEDFALWKFVEENAMQKWKFNQYDETEEVMSSIYQNLEVPLNLRNRWGCPGWHSECVAMICAILGQKRFLKNGNFDFKNGINQGQAVIDIHTGGEDHIDIHHKNERLQSKALGFDLASYWVHNKFVMVDGKKMAKADGNVFTVIGDYSKTGFYSLVNPPTEIANYLEKKYQITGFDPLAYRLLLLEHHYTEQLNFTWEKLEQSQNRLWNLRKEMAKIQSFAKLNKLEPELEPKQIQVLLEPLLDNLNISKFIEKFQAFLLDTTTEIQKNNNLNSKNLAALNYWESELLRLNLNPTIPDSVMELGQQRHQAKANKDYSKSDQIRAEITAAGYQIDDYSWGWGIWFRG